MTARVTKHLPLVAGAPEGIKKIRDLILELAVQGRLVPHLSSEKPALLPPASVGKAGAKSSELGMAEAPFDTPVQWQWRALGSVVSISGGVTLGRKLGGRKLVAKPYLRGRAQI